MEAEARSRIVCVDDEPQVLSGCEGDKIRDISVGALRSGMVLAADVKMATGTLFVARGYEITPAFLERIRNFRPGAVREPIKVLIRAA